MAFFYLLAQNRYSLRTLILNERDNVAVALVDLKKGSKISGKTIKVQLKNNVPSKHKFALKKLEEGDTVIMYGVTVGTASKPIEGGEVIGTHNVKHESSDYSIEEHKPYKWKGVDASKFEETTFQGYHRSDKQVGTANIWLVFPLVFCENRNILSLKKAFDKVLGYEKQDEYTQKVQSMVDLYNGTGMVPKNPPSIQKEIFENVEIRFITHQGGCGGSPRDAHLLCKLLAGYVKNPNVAGATVLSLGCQHAEIEKFNSALENLNCDKPIIMIDQQQAGTEKMLMTRAIEETFTALIEANEIKREPAPLSKLTIGLECGGSDGFSGISANPTLGYVSDLIASLKGKTLLSEFPELCGVEQELIKRMPYFADAEKFSKLMKQYEHWAKYLGSGFDMNPSPGNIKDGLITDAMKSAGAARKGGTSPINEVLDYTEYVERSGLNLLCTPGNDVESTTGLAGSGANIILFTTGLGTPTGNPISPVIKVSSNTALSHKMPDIIDFDTGPIITGEKTIRETGEELLNFIVKVASGEVMTKADRLRQHDFIQWKRGVSL